MNLNGAWLIGLAAGAAWSALNMEAFKRLAIVLSSPEKNRKALIGILLAKFGLLYPAAAVLLWSGVCSRAAFAVGLTVMLAWNSAAIFRKSREKVHV